MVGIRAPAKREHAAGRVGRIWETGEGRARWRGHKLLTMLAHFCLARCLSVIFLDVRMHSLNLTSLTWRISRCAYDRIEVRFFW
jgi:hypothetical protein